MGTRLLLNGVACFEFPLNSSCCPAEWWWWGLAEQLVRKQPYDQTLLSGANIPLFICIVYCTRFLAFDFDHTCVATSPNRAQTFNPLLRLCLSHCAAVSPSFVSPKAYFIIKLSCFILGSESLTLHQLPPDNLIV